MFRICSSNSKARCNQISRPSAKFTTFTRSRIGCAAQFVSATGGHVWIMTLGMLPVECKQRAITEIAYGYIWSPYRGASLILDTMAAGRVRQLVLLIYHGQTVLQTVRARKSGRFSQAVALQKWAHARVLLYVSSQHSR